MAREQKIRGKAAQTANQGARANAVTAFPLKAANIEKASEVQWPSWPTSKPGPWSTPPMPGTRPINALRPEQFTAIDYQQETGEPGAERAAKTGTVRSDQRDPRRKQKKRL
jgi:hypothetical protein